MQTRITELETEVELLRSAVGIDVLEAENRNLRERLENGLDAMVEENLRLRQIIDKYVELVKQL